MLPDPVHRDAERMAARWGLLGEAAAPVFAPGARYPMAGLLQALPALEATGLLECARAVYGRLRNAFYGLDATLLTLVFLALVREPRAEGATRVPPAALGRALGLDRAPEVKTIRRKLAELAAAGKAEELITALARHHGQACREASALPGYGQGRSGRSASRRQVLGEPAAGWAARGFEAFYVGVEMTVGQDHELLGLVRLVVGGDGEFGRDEVVARCH